MRMPLPRKSKVQTAREVAEQSARSKEVLDRVDRVLRTAAASMIDDYNLADQERQRGENRDPR